jgi:hypothetical protein
MTGLLDQLGKQRGPVVRVTEDPGDGAIPSASMISGMRSRMSLL